MKKINLSHYFFIFLVLVMLRNFLEGPLEKNQMIGLVPEPFHSLQVNLAHFFAYYFIVFSGITILVSIFFRKKPSEFLHLLLLSTPILYIVPIVDYIISNGMGFKLHYPTGWKGIPSEFLNGFNPFVRSEFITPGQKTAFLVGFSALIGYGTHTIRKFSVTGMLRILGSGISLYIWIFFTGMIPLIFSSLSGGNWIFKLGGIFPSDTEKFALLFLSIMPILLFFVLRIEENRLMRHITPAIVLGTLFLFLVFLGGFLLGFRYISLLPFSAFKNPADFLLFPALLWESFFISLLIFKPLGNNSFVYAFFSLLFSLGMGFTPFYITVILIGLVLVYFLVPSLSDALKKTLTSPIFLLLCFILGLSLILRNRAFNAITLPLFIFLFFFPPLIIWSTEFRQEGFFSYFLLIIAFFIPALVFKKMISIFFSLLFLVWIFVFRKKNLIISGIAFLCFLFIGVLTVPLSCKKFELSFKQKEQAYEKFDKYLKEENFLNAKKINREIFRKERDPAKFMVNQGIILSYQEKYDSAYSYLNMGFLLGERSAQTYAYLGKALLWKGQYKSAENFLKRSIKLNPDFSVPLTDLGYLYLKKEEFHKSLVFYKRALEKDPENPRIWNNTGVVYLRMGKKDSARKYFEKALSINPNLKSARKNLKSLNP